MGQQTSKPKAENLDPEEESYYFLQEIQKMSLKNRRQVFYYWVDPRIYSAENQKYFAQFNKSFKIESFTSIDGLKSEIDEIYSNQIIKIIVAASLPDDQYRYLQNEKKISQVFLFCSNEERAKLLCKNFDKIKGFGLKCPQVIEVLKKFQAQDNLDVPPCTLLSMLDIDRKVLNKYRLNYYCITNKQSRESGKKSFADLATTIFPDQQEKIQNFIQNYSINLSIDEGRKQVLQWAFDESFFYRLIQSLPKATIDPKKLAYLRLPFGDLYDAIFTAHKSIQKTPKELYIVVQLNPEEIAKLNQNQSLGNFIIFTSFVKGYTKKADAIKQFKDLEKGFLFEVIFTKFARQKALDFGYCISEDKNLKKNVLFNIYNFFTLQSFQIEQRQGTIIYGSLSEAFYNRADPQSRRRVTQNQNILLRNFDYLQELIKKDNSQAAILQMSGYFKQSLYIYDKKVQYLKKTNAPSNILHKYILLRGDAYRMNEDFEEAEKEYKSIIDEQTRLIAQVHLLELYLKKNDQKKAQQIQQQLQLPSNFRKLKQRDPEEGFKAENYIALSWMKQGKFKQALKKYKNLQSEISLYYQYRFQGIPLVHDIFRNMATCENRLGNFKQSLNLLTSTKDWQIVCEGQSAGVAITEELIHTVHEQMGNKEMAKQTKKNIQELRTTIGLAQTRYIKQSKIIISYGQSKPKNINESTVQINMNPPKQINQSSVNIDLNPPKQINQSSVNIDLNPTYKPINIEQSKVEVNMNPIQKNNFVNHQGTNSINLDEKKPVNLQNSIINIKI